MDQIALISDIHGNVPALETVLQDIRLRGIRRIFCLGDMVGKGPHPDEAVDICKDVCEKTIIGNWDASIANENPSFPFPEELQFHVDWHRHRLGPERLDYLKNLPGTINFFMSGNKVRLFHASQRGVYYRVFHNDPLEKHLAMFDNTDFTSYMFEPDVVGYADIHYPYRRTYDEKILFNVGSVGNPLDKPLACYEILEGEFGGKQVSPFSIHVVRLEYNIDLAVKQAQESKMPDIAPYENELRTARYRNMK
jgi:predicted phosphodiesterase